MTTTIPDQNVLIYKSFQNDSSCAEKISQSQLIEQFPQVIKESGKHPRIDERVSLQDLITGKVFLAYPLNVYLKQSLKSMDAQEFVNETKSIIEKLLRNGDEENFEKLIDYIITFLDVCSDLFKESYFTEVFEELHKQLEAMVKLCERFAKDFSAMMAAVEAPLGKPHRDCYIEWIRLERCS